MNAHERADMLCREAEKLGLDNPTEGMISDAFADMEFNFAQEKRSIETRLTTANATIESLKEERAILQSQVDNADVNLEQVRITQKGIWRTKIESAEARIAELEKENESLRKESAKKDREIERLRGALQDMVTYHTPGDWVDTSGPNYSQLNAARAALTRIATLNQKEGN